MPTTTLQSLLQAHFSAWYTNPANKARIESLSQTAKDSLMRLVLAEVSGTPTFEQRDRYVNDLCSFDIVLNEITSELLCSWLSGGMMNAAVMSGVRFFTDPPSAQEQDHVVQTMMRDGYCLSPLSLSVEQMTQLKARLMDKKFRTKGARPNTLSGAELLAYETSWQLPPTNDGDTYWLDDMDGLSHDPLFIKLAFDPYIIAVASRYLGCPPIHVQTNAWFSFPGETSKHNLSMNGQLFHQDKEFVKFFKAFIYLSDVGPEQGPHSYVEGSQHDELHRKGVGLSARVADADIGKYYERARIKTITGPAGSILFGDTSCVHKGEAVTRGMRTMLQLEYASSLYLSPVPPFSDFTDPDAVLRQYPQKISVRMVNNYSTSQRRQYLQYESTPRAKPDLKTKLRILVSRVKRRLVN